MKAPRQLKTRGKKQKAAREERTNKPPSRHNSRVSEVIDAGEILETPRLVAGDHSPAFEFLINLIAVPSVKR